MSAVDSCFGVRLLSIGRAVHTTAKAIAVRGNGAVSLLLGCNTVECLSDSRSLLLAFLPLNPLMAALKFYCSGLSVLLAIGVELRLLEGAAERTLEFNEFRDAYLAHTAQIKDWFEDLKRRVQPDVVLPHRRDRGFCTDYVVK